MFWKRYLCGDVVGVIGCGLSSGIDQCFVHVEHQGYFFVSGLAGDVLRDDEGVLLSDPVIEIVFKLSRKRGTVVRKRNWTNRLLFQLIISFSGSNFLPAFITACLMNILPNNYNSYGVTRWNNTQSTHPSIFSAKAWKTTGKCE